MHFQGVLGNWGVRNAVSHHTLSRAAWHCLEPGYASCVFVTNPAWRHIKLQSLRVNPKYT